ncbi:MAG: PQQ-binding-like beta-propeller repeat protein [Clostridia bacterium]|nr:PQQ-binding-like beta-propeller repeat protein [Clostridia bacterium]
MGNHFSWPTFGGNPQHTGLGCFPVTEKPKPSSVITGLAKPGSGVVADSAGTCYFGTEKSLVAVKDGSIKWNVPLDYPVYGAPTLYEAKNMLYVGTSKVLAVSVSDGTIKWNYKRENVGIFTCVPLLIEKYNLVVMVSQLISSQDQYRLLALDADSGVLRWELPMITMCSPCASHDEETIYLGEENNKFYAISASNGAVKWTYPARGRVRANPCVASDGTIYFVDAPDNPPSAIALVALDANGAEKWRYYPNQYSNNSSPAIGPDGTIYVGFYGIHAVNPDGTKKWERREEQSYYCGTPVADCVGNVLYSDETGILCYSSEGVLLWTLNDAKRYTSICLAPGNTVYYLNNNGVTSVKAEAAPAITRLAYSGADLLVEWDPIGYADFVVSLYDLEGTMKLNIPVSGRYTHIDKSLDDTKTYAVFLTALINGEPGPKSEERYVITQSPEITLVGYSTDNLQESLDISWKGVDKAPLYIATLFDEEGTFKENFPTTETECCFLRKLEEEKSYRVKVVAGSSDGIVMGPDSKTFEPIVKTVKSLNLYYTGTSLVALWQADTDSAELRFIVEMVKNDAKLPEEKTTQNRLVFDYDLETGSIYKVHVRMESGIVQGPWTEFAGGPYRAEVVYEYDKAGRLKKVVWNGGLVLSYDFDKAGNVVKVEYSEV